MTTDSNFSEYNEQDLLDVITILLNKEFEHMEQAKVRRQKLRDAFHVLLKLREVKFLGVENRFYYGPNADNDKYILELGRKANTPLKQMTIDGKRTRTRRPRPRPYRPSD